MAAIHAMGLSAKPGASNRRAACVVRAVNGLVTAPKVGGMTVALPQKDPDQSARAARLEAQRALLQFDHEYLPGVVVAKNVPQVEAFSPIYQAERTKQADNIAPNAFATMARSKTDPLDQLQDFEDFFNEIPLPAVAKAYRSDESFAEQRLSGANPLAIKLLKKDDPRCNVLHGIQNPSIDVGKELEKNHVFICDYTGTDPDYRGPSMVSGNVGKWLPKPLAFFHWNGKALVPLAIQILATADPKEYKPTGARVYTPDEEWNMDWFFAKTCVQIADGNHHEMCTHLARCHFTMEPIAIGTSRQLEYSHPLNVLLRVHMRFVMANNLLAHGTFFLPQNGTLENLLPGTFPETKSLLVEAYDTWDLRRNAFPQDLVNRGVANHKVLPKYAYRDDGQLLWDAIHDFVKSYLKYWYPKDELVKNDVELQNWARELSDQGPTGGRVKGMPSKIDTVTDLIEICTSIIFTCGPTHSAVNFGQAEYIAFVANMPLCAYKNINEMAQQQDPVTESQMLQMLPPAEKTMMQLNVITTIATYHYDVLGQYDKSFNEMYQKTFNEVFADHEPVLNALDKFQCALEKVENTIEDRNEDRRVPFNVMKPSLVMNSISI